ncbi:hypothetical protein M885DRAFT_513489 [Pelagophyceae sp. CCMP2097]|nr:hypothetical protein M885DRAFT_513489 [Pelagophyceae sp. CCMP2097]
MSWLTGPAAAAAGSFDLLVTAPMPAGQLWSASEFRRYLRGLGHKPLPSVGQIAAALAHVKTREEYGVRMGVTDRGTKEFGTTPSLARKRLIEATLRSGSQPVFNALLGGSADIDSEAENRRGRSQRTPQRRRRNSPAKPLQQQTLTQSLPFTAAAQDRFDDAKWILQNDDSMRNEYQQAYDASQAVLTSAQKKARHSPNSPRSVFSDGGADSDDEDDAARIYVASPMKSHRLDALEARHALESAGSRRKALRPSDDDLFLSTQRSSFGRASFGRDDDDLGRDDDRRRRYDDDDELPPPPRAAYAPPPPHAAYDDASDGALRADLAYLRKRVDDMDHDLVVERLKCAELAMECDDLRGEARLQTGHAAGPEDGAEGGVALLAFEKKMQEMEQDLIGEKLKCAEFAMECDELRGKARLQAMSQGYADMVGGEQSQGASSEAVTFFQKRVDEIEQDLIAEKLKCAELAMESEELQHKARLRGQGDKATVEQDLAVERMKSAELSIELDDLRGRAQRGEDMEAQQAGVSAKQAETEAELEGNLIDARLKCAELAMEVETLRGSVRVQVAKNSAVLADRLSEEREAMELNVALAKSNAQVEAQNLENQVSEAKSETQKAKAQIQESADALEAREMDLAAARVAAADAEVQGEELQQRLDAETAEHLHEAERAERLSVSLSETLQELDAEREAHESLKDDLATAKMVAAEASQRCDELQLQLRNTAKDSGARAGSLEDDVANARAEVLQLQIQADDVVNAVQRQADDAAAAHGKEVARLQAKIATLDGSAPAPKGLFGAKAPSSAASAASSQGDKSNPKAVAVAAAALSAKAASKSLAAAASKAAAAQQARAALAQAQAQLAELDDLHAQMTARLTQKPATSIGDRLRGAASKAAPKQVAANFDDDETDGSEEKSASFDDESQVSEITEPPAKASPAKKAASPPPKAAAAPAKAAAPPPAAKGAFDDDDSDDDSAW